MRNWVIIIMISLSVGFLGIINVKAYDFPNLEDYESLGSAICEYNSTSDKVWCAQSNGFTPILAQNNSYINEYNSNGYLIMNGVSWYWVAGNSNYYSTKISYFDGTSWVTTCLRSNNCNFQVSYDSNSFITYYKPVSDSVDFYTPILSDKSKVNQFYATTTEPYYFNPNDVSNSFNVSYEQGEVLMAGTGSSANLVTINISSINLNPVDYIFSYSYNLNDNELPSNFTFIPTCSTFVNSNEDIEYTCYYNIPMFFNTYIHFMIVDKETSDIVYSDDYSAYLNILPSDSYYTIYQVNGYKYFNISDIDSGSFALSKELAYVESGIGTLQPNYDIYVIDYSNNTKIDFESSSYFISKSIDNGLAIFNFDFNGNTNLYLLIDIRLYNMFVDEEPVYLYAPSSSYVHLSSLLTCDSNSVDFDTCIGLLDSPTNQQSYKDSNGDIHYVNNDLVYDDTTGTEFSNIFGKSLLTFSSVFSTIGILYTSFVSGLPSPILFAIYLSFGLLITCIVIKIWL